MPPRSWRERWHMWPEKPTVHDTDNRFTDDPVVWFPQKKDEPFRTCSYCGSIRPEDLLKLFQAEQQPRADEADWKYGYPHKFYFTIPKPGALLVPIGPSEFTERYPEGKVPDHLLGYDLSWWGKFYTRHLTELDRLEFNQLAPYMTKVGSVVWEMDSDGRVKWGRKER